MRVRATAERFALTLIAAARGDLHLPTNTSAPFIAGW